MNVKSNIETEEKMHIICSASQKKMAFFLYKRGMNKLTTNSKTKPTNLKLKTN